MRNFVWKRWGRSDCRSLIITRKWGVSVKVSQLKMQLLLVSTHCRIYVMSATVHVRERAIWHSSISSSFESSGSSERCQRSTFARTCGDWFFRCYSRKKWATCESEHRRRLCNYSGEYVRMMHTQYIFCLARNTYHLKKFNYNGWRPYMIMKMERVMR